MTTRWEPQLQWRRPDSYELYLEELLDKVTASTVATTYRIERATGPHKQLCVAEVGGYDGDSWSCGATAKYIVVTRVENGLKGTVRENRSPACRLQHMSRRVREYFGLVRAVQYEDTILKRTGVQK